MAENSLRSLSKLNARKFAREIANGRNILYKLLIIKTPWRRGRDSNPRYPFRYAGFQDRSHQPLGHLSAVRGTLRLYGELSRFGDRRLEQWALPGAQSDSRSPRLPLSAAPCAATSCLATHRPGRPTHRSCAGPRSSRRNGPQRRGLWRRHRRNRPPVTRYCHRR